MTEHEPKILIDHSPKSPLEEQFFANADQVYTFMEKIYPIYSRMRFRGAAFMPEPEAELSGTGQESISDHMWAATLFFRVMLPVLPHVSRSIDKYKVKEFIEVHDIGELENGDISAVLQLQGHGKNRETLELKAYKNLISLLPDASQQDLMTHLVYEEEKNDANTHHKEVLLAKIFDMLQGDHYVLTQSINFQQYGDIHQKIVSSKLLPYADRLEQVFQEEDNKAAAVEVRLLMQHHLYQYQTQGVLIPYPTIK